MAAATRRRATAFLWLLSIPLLALGLHALARHKVLDALSDQAAQELALAANGETPWVWTFDRPAALVAGRVFGANEFAFEQGALVVHAPDATFEIGLPLPRAVDIHRYDGLALTLDTDAPATLSLVTRASLTAPQVVSAALPLPQQARSFVMDLAQLHWRDERGASTRPGDAAGAIAMLRLRFALAPGTVLTLRSARLLRAAALEKPDLALLPTLRPLAAAGSAEASNAWLLPADGTQLSAQLETLRERLGPDRNAVLVLPDSGRLERQLALRDRALRILPAASVIPASLFAPTWSRAHALAGDQTPPPTPQAGQPARDPAIWLAIALYALALLALWRAPPRNARVRAALEALGALGGLLALIMAGGLGDNIEAPVWALIGVVSAFVLSLKRPPELPRWHWIGPAAAAWLPLAAIALCVLLAALLHPPGATLRPPSAGHILRYVLWALLQQYLICVVLADRLRCASGQRSATIVLAALVFALLHTPNPALMQATFVGGLIWVTAWLQHRALLPIALSHAVCALLLSATLPSDVLRSVEVSARFFL